MKTKNKKTKQKDETKNKTQKTTEIKTDLKSKDMRAKNKSSVADKDDLKTKSLSEYLDERHGKRGNEKREKLETELEELRIMLMLKALRKKEKITLYTLATRMNVDKSVVSKLENKSDDQRLSTIIRYVKALKAKMYVRFEVGEETEELELV